MRREYLERVAIFSRAWIVGEVLPRSISEMCVALTPTRASICFSVSPFSCRMRRIAPSQQSAYGLRHPVLLS